MKKGWVVVLMLGIFSTTNAQTRYFVQFGGNLSILPTSTYNGQFINEFAPNPNATRLESRSAYSSQPGWGIKAGASREIAKRWQLNAAITYSYIRYQQKNKVKGTTVSESNISGFEMEYNGIGYAIPGLSGNGLPVFGTGPVLIDPTTTGDPDKLGKASLGFIGLEAGIMYELLPKLKLGAGASLQQLINVRYYYPEYEVRMQPGPGQGPTILHTTVTKSTDKDPFTPFGAAIQLHAAYQLSRKFSLDLTGKQFLTKLYEENGQDYTGKKARIRLLSLGLRYSLN